MNKTILIAITFLCVSLSGVAMAQKNGENTNNGKFYFTVDNQLKSINPVKLYDAKFFSVRVYSAVPGISDLTIDNVNLNSTLNLYVLRDNGSHDWVQCLANVPASSCSHTDPSEKPCILILKGEGPSGDELGCTFSY